MELNIYEIQELLPHRYPFLLVDKIIDMVPLEYAVGVKNVTANEVQFLGHFPEEPIMPGVLLIEAMAQVGGCALLYPEENRGKLVVFGKIDNVRFRRKVIPGDQVVTKAVITRLRRTIGTVHCEGMVDGELACECDATFALAEKR